MLHVSDVSSVYSNIYLITNRVLKALTIECCARYKINFSIKYNYGITNSFEISPLLTRPRLFSNHKVIFSILND
jgi:hypothetical protein